MTWETPGATRAFIDGVQVGGDRAIIGTWIGDLDNTLNTIGAGSTVPANVWSGNIGPVALWNKALAADQIAYLSKV